MPLMTRLKQFAQSPQGQALTRRAMDVARDPRTKAKLDDARRRFAQRCSGHRPG